MRPAVAALLAGLLFAAAPAIAVSGQPVCGLRADIVKILSETYHEKKIDERRADGFVFEYFASDDTWTIIATLDNTACLMAAGKKEDPHENDIGL